MKQTGIHREAHHFSHTTHYQSMICTFCNGEMHRDDSVCPHCNQTIDRHDADIFPKFLLETLNVVSLVVLVASPFAGLLLWLADTPEVFALTLCRTLVAWLAWSYFSNRAAGKLASVAAGVTAAPDDGQGQKLLCDVIGSSYLLVTIFIYAREFVRIFTSP